jgi:hypothetical protein
MGKEIITTLLLLLFLNYVFAQQGGTKLKFHSVNQAGLLQGEHFSAIHLQTVNGVQYKNWFAGAGLGLDYYKFKSIPLFADLKKYFGASRNQFFLYADGGTSFVWKSKGETDSYPTGNYSDKNPPGFYSNTGLGYKAGLKNGMAFLLSAGYSYKRVNEKQEQTICPFTGPCYIQTDTYKYDFNRLIIQIGWLF